MFYLTYSMILHTKLYIRKVIRNYRIHAKQKEIVNLFWLGFFLCVPLSCFLTKLVEVQTSGRGLFWQMENGDIFVKDVRNHDLSRKHIPHSYFIQYFLFKEGLTNFRPQLHFGIINWLQIHLVLSYIVLNMY